MRKRAWTALGALGLLFWAGIGAGLAQAGTIPPFSPSSSGVTVSIFQNVNGVFQDMTDSYRPEWAPGAPPQTVYIVVNPSAVTPTPAAPMLVAPSTTPPSATTPNPFLVPPTTSAYPGQCTNFNVGPATDTGPDFTFDNLMRLTINGLTGYSLISNDCGGRAVIKVGSDLFIIPKDLNNNGIADSWEAAFCPGNTCPLGTEDTETSVGNPSIGDGIAALDEYRGFIVSGNHIRTDPGQKDLFVHLVNPQCGAASLLLTTGPYFANPAIPLFGNLNTLISGHQIHVLDYIPNAANTTTAEWRDAFVSYSPPTGVLFFSPGTTTPTPTPPPFDRQINAYAVYPNRDATGAPIAQKGARIIECLDTSTPSLLGFASLGSPNGPDNAILFTQNIVNYLTITLGGCTATVPCSYFTFQGGAWIMPVAGNISQTDLIARAIQFYLAMEIGHTTQLTPTVEGTTKTSYGYHHAPGTGSNLDQAITNKLSNKTGNTFYIPSLYNTSDLQSYQLK